MSSYSLVSQTERDLLLFGMRFFDPNREVKEAALEALADKRGVDVTPNNPQGLNDANPESRFDMPLFMGKGGRMAAVGNSGYTPVLVEL